MRTLVLGVVAAVAALGCERTPEQRTQELCDYYCGCTLPLPAQQDACVRQCADEVFAVSDPCVDCFVSLECGPELEELLDRGACAETCNFGGD